ncbi:MAG: DMT family transporter [Peptostreptococcaceae bacterium]|nr:DMT family transporter [Peptostreptococcaceae bacterium]
MTKKMRGNIFLLITATVWGIAFVAQRSSMDYIGPFTFSGIRLMLASIVLLPVMAIFSPNPKLKEDGEKKTEAELAIDKKNLIKGGITTGVALFIATSLQQIGIQYTTAGKAGFITALYVVFVPLIGYVLLHKKVSKLIFFCVVMAAVGLYLLCMTEGDFSLNKGDTLELLCAIGFAVHILTIDHYSPLADGIKMSSLQFFVAGGLALICMVVFEEPNMPAILDAAVPILYAGIISAGVGYTLQILAQKDTDPTVASLILSLESVFAVIAGTIILHEAMTTRELLGCLVMFAAIVLAQQPTKEERRQAKIAKEERLIK